MINTIYPCLWFNGQAAAAAEMYCSSIKNSALTSVTPMVVLFELNGKKIMGLNGGPNFSINPSISMFVQYSSTDECRQTWEKLSEGATVMMQLDQYPWSELYGWIKDKFGFTWQIMKSETEQVMPSLLFTGLQFGRAEEAMNFYTGIFPGSVIKKKNIYPDSTPFPGKISFAEFHLNGYPVIAMDGPGEHEFSFNEAVSFVVDCETQEDIDFYWNNLIAGGGTESMCGWCKDKFGVWWQIVPADLGKLLNDPEKGKRSMEAMFKMKKLDISKLRTA